MKARIVLSGYYGCGNVGDEAVLTAILESLRAELPESSVCVLSADPEETRRSHGVEAVHRYKPQDALKVLRRGSLLISGGGSLLQDVTSSRSLLYYLGVIALALMRGCRVMIYAQGIGPLHKQLSRGMARLILDRAAAITVRDPESEALLRGLGVDRPPVAVTADPAFLLTPAPEEWIARQRAGWRLEAGQPIIGFAVRPWPAAGPLISLFAETADRVAESLGARPVFFCLHRGEDERLAEEIAGAMRSPAAVVKGDYTPSEWMGMVGACRLLVGMRLHALIFAVARGVPVAGLSYDPKVESLLKRVGAWRGLEANSAGSARLFDAITSLWESVTEREQLKGAACRMRSAAQQNMAVLLSLLERQSL
ncbi:MAG: polysaccharide pyruvyl transferase CsaB [Armatimonadetes bacterium]|nr:polysaccharide pyruvyl transferase CsaB [Armatimonadota bacterium]